MDVVHHRFVIGLQARHVAGEGSLGDAIAVFDPHGNHLLGGDSLVGQIVVQNRVPVGRSARRQQVRCGAALRAVHKYKRGILGRIGICQRQEFAELVECRGFSERQHDVLPCRAVVAVCIERHDGFGEGDAVGIMRGRAHIAAAGIQASLFTLIASGGQIGDGNDGRCGLWNVERDVVADRARCLGHGQREQFGHVVLLGVLHAGGERIGAGSHRRGKSSTNQACARKREAGGHG